MNNDNNIQPNKDFLDQVIEANLSEEKRKKLNLNKEGWKDDRVEPIKTATDQDKIEAYDRLGVKDLPEDWAKDLARIAQLEENQLDYEAKKEELKGWTNAFIDKKPNEVQEEINKLEAKQKETEEELNSWKDTFKDQTPAEVKEEKAELVKKDYLNQTKITELEQKLGEWKESFNGRELKEVKEEWEILQKRPDITISEEEFYDDYARRIAPDQLEKLHQELTQNKDKTIKLQAENERLTQAINHVLENWCTIRWMLANSATTPIQAEKEIERLLTNTKQSWENVLNKTNNLIPLKKEEEIALDLFLKKNEDKRSSVEQTLEYIEEAQETREYQKLFERWNRGKQYNEEYEFDGSLFLLKRYLEKCSPDLPTSTV